MCATSFMEQRIDSAMEMTTCCLLQVLQGLGKKQLFSCAGKKIKNKKREAGSLIVEAAILPGCDQSGNGALLPISKNGMTTLTVRVPSQVKMNKLDRYGNCAVEAKTTVTQLFTGEVNGHPLSNYCM